MIVFEVLFKHPNIVTAPPVIDMESVGARNTHNMPYCKAIFQKYVKQLVVSFARFRELDDLDLKQKAVEYRKDALSQANLSYSGKEPTIGSIRGAIDIEDNSEMRSENGVESEGDGIEACSSTGGTIVSKGDGDCTINANDDTESMASAVSALSLARAGGSKFNTTRIKSKASNDVMDKIEYGIYEVN